MDVASGAFDERRLIAVVAASSAYVAAAMVANVMSVRIVAVVGFTIDAGTLTYPLTFTLRDVVHKVAGRSVARAVILLTAGLNVMMAMSLWLAARLPAATGVSGPAQEAFGPVLVGTWRIVLASIVAMVVAELLDTEVYHRFVARFGPRRQWGRVVVSNAVSIPVDSVVFVAIAFGGSIAIGDARSIVWANIVVKGLTSIAFTPLIYAVKERDPELGATAPVAGATG